MAGGAAPLAAIARQPMRRAHRSVHRLVWPFLAFAVMFGIVTALALRPPPDEPTQEARP